MYFYPTRRAVPLARTTRVPVLQEQILREQALDHVAEAQQHHTAHEHRE